MEWVSLSYPTGLCKLFEWTKSCFFAFLCHLQAEEFADPEVHHRHLSHLFGLFPGHSINVEKAPDLCKAAEKTLIKRGSCCY